MTGQLSEQINDLQLFLAVMKSAKDKDRIMNVWDRDIRAVEYALSRLTAPHAQEATAPANGAAKRLVALLEKNAEGYLPGYGNVINVTVSVTDAKALIDLLSPPTASPAAAQGEISAQGLAAMLEPLIFRKTILKDSEGGIADAIAEWRGEDSLEFANNLLGEVCLAMAYKAIYLLRDKPALRAASPAPGEGWRPIETAPFMDQGRGYLNTVDPILISDGKTVRPHTRVMKTNDGKIGLFADDYKPKFWMPFPSPPALASTSAPSSPTPDDTEGGRK